LCNALTTKFSKQFKSPTACFQPIDYKIDIGARRVETDEDRSGNADPVAAVAEEAVELDGYAE